MDDETAVILLLRGLALHAAASAWSGLSAITDRNASIIATAEEFEQWLIRPIAEDEQEALEALK